MATLIQNVHDYYLQYLPHVEKALETGLGPVEKHLQVRHTFLQITR